MNSITKLDEFILESRIGSVNFLAKDLEAKYEELGGEFTKQRIIGHRCLYFKVYLRKRNGHEGLKKLLYYELL